jgi:hypothetical protein
MYDEMMLDVARLVADVVNAALHADVMIVVVLVCGDFDRLVGDLVVASRTLMIAWPLVVMTVVMNSL